MNDLLPQMTSMYINCKPEGDTKEKDRGVCLESNKICWLETSGWIGIDFAVQ